MVRESGCMLSLQSLCFSSTRVAGFSLPASSCRNVNSSSAWIIQRLRAAPLTLAYICAISAIVPEPYPTLSVRLLSIPKRYPRRISASRKIWRTWRRSHLLTPPFRYIKKAAGTDDPAISARNWAKVGDLYAANGNREAALKAYRQALAKEELASGPVHPRVAVRLNDLAQLLEPKAAEPVVRRALSIETKTLGAQNPSTAITMNNLANVLLQLRRLAEAETIGRQVYESARSHPRIQPSTCRDHLQQPCSNPSREAGSSRRPSPIHESAGC